MNDDNGKQVAEQGTVKQVQGHKTLVNEQFSFEVNIEELKKKRREPHNKYFIIISFVNEKGDV